MNWNGVLTKKEHILTKQIKADVVAVLDLKEDNFFYLIDGLASHIWIEIDGEKNLNDVIGSMRHHVSQLPYCFQDDVEKLIADLINANMLAWKIS